MKKQTKKKHVEKVPHEKVEEKGRSSYSDKPIVKDKSKYEDYEEEDEEETREL